MANAAVEAMLGSTRSFAVAAAGCGKTELLSQLVADQRSGRQLVLTHTHAGVAAIKKRLAELRVPHDKFHLDTIAGWCLRYCAAYPAISGVQSDVEEYEIDWKRLTPKVYPGTAKVCRSTLGKRVLKASYDGVLIDEYQDCSERQHEVILSLREQIPCRGVGDPLQSIFGFRGDPVVQWDTIKRDFNVLDDALTEPWRWRREGRSAPLGEWLVAARRQLETNSRLVISNDAPVTFIPCDDRTGHEGACAAVCRTVPAPHESMIAILKWPKSCLELANRLKGQWPIVEKFDDPDLLKLGAVLADADGATVVAEFVKFVADRMTGIGPALKTIVNAIKNGRGVGRISKNRDQADRLAKLASERTPANALEWLENVLRGHRNDWCLYRRECVVQLLEALRHCTAPNFSEMPILVAEARTRARHRGRLTPRRTIGTPLLVKGLEFDHAVISWEPDHLSVEGLYVALTRSSKSLTIVARSRTLDPSQM